MKYRITLNGVTIADGLALLKAVFPQWNGEPAEWDTACITVTFATPQTPTDLGPLVKVEQVA